MHLSLQFSNPLPSTSTGSSALPTPNLPCTSPPPLLPSLPSSARCPVFQPPRPTLSAQSLIWGRTLRLRDSKLATNHRYVHYPFRLHSFGSFEEIYMDRYCRTKIGNTNTVCTQWAMGTWTFPSCNNNGTSENWGVPSGFRGCTNLGTFLTPRRLSSFYRRLNSQSGANTAWTANVRSLKMHSWGTCDSKRYPSLLLPT
jgi:hypothetical protein